MAGQPCPRKEEPPADEVKLALKTVISKQATPASQEIACAPPSLSVKRRVKVLARHGAEFSAGVSPLLLIKASRR